MTRQDRGELEVRHAFKQCDTGCGCQLNTETVVDLLPLERALTRERSFAAIQGL